MTHTELLRVDELSLDDFHSHDSKNPPGIFDKLLCDDRGRPAQKFLNASQNLDLDEGTIILSHTQKNLYCYEVIEGLTALSRVRAPKKKQVLNFTFGADIIPLFEPADGFEIRALTPVAIVKYPLSKLDALLSKSASFGLNLCTYRNRILCNQMEHIYTIGKRPALERVVFFLLGILRRQSENENMSLTLFHPISRLDIGNYLGITIETTSRCFSQLRREGFIDFKNSSETEILELESLKGLLK